MADEICHATCLPDCTPTHSIWPSMMLCYVRVLQPGAEAAAPKPQGMLFVRVCGATDVPRFDWKSIVSKPDTFVSCAFVPHLHILQRRVQGLQDLRPLLACIEQIHMTCK